MALKEMMLRSPTFFCAIARPDWIADLLATDKDALAGTIDAAAEISANIVGSIFSHPDVEASDLVDLCANDNLTPVRIARIFDHTKASRVQEILDNANITIQKGQEIVDAMSDPTKIGTGGRRGYIGDDWEDNRLTSRDKAATLATTFDKIFAYFRPEWTEVAAGWGASGGELVSSANGAEIGIPSEFTVGTWEWDEKTESTADVPYLWFRFMWVDANNAMQIRMYGNSGTNVVGLEKYVSGSRTGLISWDRDTTVMHTIKVTRDANGNWEIFDDGVSKGTTTDTSITSSNEIRIIAENSGPTHIDNLKVY